MHGRARFSKQSTSCIRIHIRPCMTLIAAQQRPAVRLREAVEAPENGGNTRIPCEIQSAMHPGASICPTIHAATAARMNTYAHPASTQNCATKLHHADKLCFLPGNVRLVDGEPLCRRHSRASGNPFILQRKTTWIPACAGMTARKGHASSDFSSRERSRSGEFRIH